VQSELDRYISLFIIKAMPFESQISQACRPLVKGIGMWGSVKALARGYEYLMGLVILAPVAVLAWFPFVSEFQTRLLFNQAFSRGLQIQRILAGGKKNK
jgi:callose synthase